MPITPISYLNHQGPRPVVAGPSRCICTTAPSSRLGRKFMIFAPWCDQGLGVQAKSYVGWFQKLGYAVCVYACSPRKVSVTSINRMQADPNEWATEIKVLYDARSRETVPAADVARFCTDNSVTDVLMLETCHKNSFVISARLSQKNVRVYAVPNIELVRTSELPYFREARFHRILCSNEYTRDILRRLGVPKRKLAHFPFAIEDVPKKVPLAEKHVGDEPVRFLIVGGMNCERRKQASKVIASFIAAFPQPTARATLTVLCQGIEAPRAVVRPDVRVVKGHTPYAHVLQHYANSHIVIMLSRAEGIGLCTHEALRAGCALLTMTTPLFSQLVAPGLNGFMIKGEIERGAAPARLVGNHESVIRTYTFRVRGLASAFRTIVTPPMIKTVAAMQSGARRSYEAIFSEDRVKRAYRRALNVAPA